MAADQASGRASRLLEYLPAIFQDDGSRGRSDFVGRFLLAFEKILLGLGDPQQPGIEEILGGVIDPASGASRLAGVHRYFELGADLPDDQRVPGHFLQWLSGWVALTLRADLDEMRQRDFIARAASLYRLRGTKEGLAKAINIYTRLAPSIEETDTPFQLGVHSTVGEDTILNGGAPHFFSVTVRLATIDLAEMKKQMEVIAAIVDLEKPAHTQYSLRAETPTMQIGVHSTIGIDTLLGGPK